jgi:uncharacterized membrane protein
MKKEKWMNEKTISELKKRRGFLHRMSLSLMIMFMFFLMIFLFTWCFTDNTLVPFVSMVLTIISLILFATYILKRDIWSVIIFLKEATEIDEKLLPSEKKDD